MEKFTVYSQNHESYELDEILVVAAFALLFSFVFSVRRLLELKRAKLALLGQNKELIEAMSEIKQLKGIIPICASCKNIRDDEGYWHKVETYVKSNTNADFTHGICPDCVKKLYPEISDKIKDKSKTKS